MLEGAAPDNEADSLEEQRRIYNPYFPSTYVHRSGHANTDPAHYADDEDFQRNNPCRRLTMTIVQHRKQVDRLIMRFGERELFDFMEGLGLGSVVKSLRAQPIRSPLLSTKDSSGAKRPCPVPAHRSRACHAEGVNRGRMLATPSTSTGGSTATRSCASRRAIEQFNESTGKSSSYRILTTRARRARRRSARASIAFGQPNRALTGL